MEGHRRARRLARGPLDRDQDRPDVAWSIPLNLAGERRCRLASFSNESRISDPSRRRVARDCPALARAGLLVAGPKDFSAPPLSYATTPGCGESTTEKTIMAMDS